jgi:hypothetical protein
MKLTIDEVDLNVSGNLRRHSAAIRNEGLACVYGALAQLFVGSVGIALGFGVRRAFFVMSAAAFAYAVRFSWLAFRCFRAVAPRWPR